MARCGGNAVGSLVLDGAATGGGTGFRLWPLFSAAALRRKLINALLCGVSRQRKERSGAFRSPEPMKERQPLRLDTKRRNGNTGSERLSELLKAEAYESGSDEAEVETRRKIEVLEELRGVVKRLQSSGDEEEEEGARAMREDRRDAAKDVRRLAKDDSEAREMLSMLGAISPLVGMLDSNDLELQIASLYALLNIGIGNDVNKAATVKAGAVHKMLMLIESGSSPSVVEAIVANFLGLSALDSNKPIIGSSGAISFLVKIFQERSPNPSSNSQAKQDSLRALFNLSLCPSNIPHLIDSDLVPTILAAVGDMEVSERVLSVLSNVVSAPEGRRAISRTPDAFPILVDVLSWSDSPGCQEKAAYVLMVMAHKAYRDRTAMIEAGVVSSLLELTLLGSALAQKRASRVLECLRVDKGKQISEGFEGGGCSGASAVSAPQCGGGPSDGKGEEAEEEESTMSDERKAVKQLVQQSLQNNMRRIVKRANLPQDFSPSDHFKTLTATSTSKSVPF